jgi:hypothetical protein
VVDVMPGKHRVTAGARSVEVAVVAGETKDAVLLAEGLAAPPHFESPARSHEDAPPPRVDPPGTIWKPLTFVLGGATLIAGGAALYFNSTSHGHADDASALRDGVGPARCGVPNAPAKCGELQTALDDAGSAAGLSKGMWVAAGVLALATGASTFLWLTHGAPSGSGRLSPSIGPGTAGAVYQLAF